MSINVLDSFKAIVDDAFRDAPLNISPQKEFQKLENYIFERLR